ncbi:zinc finger protein 287-like [Cotesia glomerata]|uniref:C2H2-type domain-containing protein n=1 Tax=Cotesia glomerata TaxID=32391 RepID=A0AAV7IUZ8_COTGL|nr:zinc finger protein 287-like [Cotesia glomerata]KAH0560567.1 hypothetical protein KQX54_005961 [Cotesia glomerata]
MSNININGRNVIFLSDEENDTADDLFFVKIEPIDNKEMKKILQTKNTKIKYSDSNNDNLFSKKIICHDNLNSLQSFKVKTEDPLSEQNNLSNENVETNKTNDVQKQFSIRVRSEFSEKNMIENCLLNKEVKEVSDKPHKEILTTTGSKINVQKKNSPITLLRKIAIPRKKLKFLTKPIKIGNKNFNNTPIKIESDDLRKEPPIPKSTEDDENCRTCNLIEKEQDSCRSFYCAYCGFTTSDKNTLKTHMYRHDGKPYKCVHCNYTTARPMHIKEHVKKHTGESLKCSQCSFKTIYQRSLDFHMLKHTGSPEYICEICKLGFFRPQYLKRHMRRHTKENSLECDYCKKEFFRKTHLINHINRHTGNKPYKCDICQLGFVQMYHLKRHQLTHFKEKKYSCNLCPEKFDRLYSLKRHKTSHTGDKLYECNVCKLKFIRPEHLKRHQADHRNVSKKASNKRTYKCKFCLFTALSAFDFNEHLNKHIDSNLVICNECGISFEEKKKLIMHFQHKHRNLL